MKSLVNQARELEREACANLARVPAMARAVYPDFVRDAERFCFRLSQLVKDLEAVESLQDKTG